MRTGRIPRILQETASRTGVLENVAIADVDMFLSRFTAGAERVESPTEGILDIVSASAIARWPIMDRPTAQSQSRKPFIQEYFVENAKGARVQVFDPIDLDTFTERCVSLAVYAKTVGYGSKVLKAKLDNCDIQPIAPNAGRGGFYYRRAELVACDLT